MIDHDTFRNSFGKTIFENRYRQPGGETWSKLARLVAFNVCHGLLADDEIHEIAQMIAAKKFIPGGRYLYYAGREARFWNNCYLLRCEEDSREDWAQTAGKSTLCLMTGGGIGSDYTVYRPKGAKLGRTGGVSSGPLPAMQMVNEIGRSAIQGGGRRAAIYASLAREHGDVFDFLAMKNWDDMPLPGSGGKTIGDAKRADFMFPAPMDHTNISVNYGDRWLALGAEDGHDVVHDDPFLVEARATDEVFRVNVEQALKTAEPGFSFNFGSKANETLRNACCEVTSEDDSDVCNLGSVNLSEIETIAEFERVVRAATKFLLCGSIRSEVPYEKIARVREKNRRLGLGLMGVHEWLLRRGHRYEVVPELHRWLAVYRDASDATSRSTADTLRVSRPVANRAIAPTGTIGTLAGTTTGIEPMFAAAYLRRYMVGMEVREEYVIDSTAEHVANKLGIDPDEVETALSLAEDPERRIAFQADVQDYVDMAISSTINLPQWGSEHNNPDTVDDFATLLATYAPRLRGFTCYPDGARGGQPLTRVPFAEAMAKKHETEAVDVCSLTNRSDGCGS